MREITPLSMGVAIYGLAFGVLAAQAGMSALQVGAMSSLVFAGSAQIITVERLAAGAGASIAIAAGIALNLRLLLITASIRDVFAGRPLWQRLLGAHLSTDENWAMLLADRLRHPGSGYAYLVGGGISLITTWVASTVLGVWFAHAIPAPRALGLDFAFTAAFIAIARSLWRGRPDRLPWLASFLTVAAALSLDLVDASWALIAGGLVGAASAGLRRDD